MTTTTKAAHTPGPWHWEPHGECWLLGGTNDAPETVFHVDPDGNAVPDAANRSLIAAAPDLLEALEGLISQPQVLSDALFKAKAAIQKAKGGK